VKLLSHITAEGLARVCGEDPGVQVAYLFGSRSKGSYTPESDIDIAVLLSSFQISEA